MTRNFTAVCIAFVCPAAFAQTSSAIGSVSTAQSSSIASPAAVFDVATLKPHVGVLTVSGVINRSDGVDGPASTLSELLIYAYGLRSDDQVSNGPDWVKTDRFDVQARISEAEITAMEKSTPTEKRATLRFMMQALLAERFQLKAHSQTAQVPIYDLVVAKGGPRLKDAASDSDDHLLKGKDGKPLHGFMSWTTGKTIAQGYSVKNLADFLSQPICALGRPVMDKTGLTATYNFILDWTPQHPGVRVGGENSFAPPEETPSIFTALSNLGLKLQPSTGPLETIVVDHVEHPKEN